MMYFKSCNQIQTQIKIFFFPKIAKVNTVNLNLIKNKT